MLEKPRVAQTVKYSFTLTLLPKLYGLTAEEQYDKVYLYCMKHILGITNNVSLIVETTKMYNIHMHGMLTFPINDKQKNYQKLFVDSFRKSKLLGYVNIKQVTDEDGWIQYMSKSLTETYDTLHRPPILIDNLHLFRITLDGFIQHDLSDDC